MRVVTRPSLHRLVMTMTLQLTEYEPWIENQVFGRRENSGENPVMRFVLVDTYRQPTEDEVVTYLQSKAREIGNSQILTPSGSVVTSGSSLEQLIGNLPSRTLQDLRIGEDKCLKFVI